MHANLCTNPTIDVRQDLGFACGALAMMAYARPATGGARFSLSIVYFESWFAAVIAFACFVACCVYAWLEKDLGRVYSTHGLLGPGKSTSRLDCDTPVLVTAWWFKNRLLHNLSHTVTDLGTFSSWIPLDLWVVHRIPGGQAPC